MTATFKVFIGDLVCERGNKYKKLDRKKLSDFWDKVECGGRRGVYIFGYRASRGYTPLYVGQTKKQTFKRRIYQHMYSGKFDEIIRPVKKGTPILIFIARIGSGKNSNSAIDDLEWDFINHSFNRNKNLHNDRGFEKPVYKIRGFEGSGKRSKSVSALKTIAGL